MIDFFKWWWATDRRSLYLNISSLVLALIAMGLSCYVLFGMR